MEVVMQFWPEGPQVQLPKELQHPVSHFQGVAKQLIFTVATVDLKVLAQNGFSDKKRR